MNTALSHWCGGFRLTLASMTEWFIVTEGFIGQSKRFMTGSKLHSTFRAWMYGIFHGIHEAWDDATRNASETKNIINFLHFSNPSKFFMFHKILNFLSFSVLQWFCTKLDKWQGKLNIPKNGQADAKTPPSTRSFSFSSGLNIGLTSWASHIDGVRSQSYSCHHIWSHTFFPSPKEVFSLLWINF